MRCFIGVWPDAGARAALDNIAHNWQRRFPQARRMRAANLHLTLAFIGEIDAAHARLLAAALQRVQAAHFDWMLDRIGVFNGARVLWAGGAECAHLTQLADRCRVLLDDMQIRYDRKPFVPHITLLRDLPRGLLPQEIASTLAQSIAWPVSNPHLIQSAHEPDGIRYRNVEAELQD